MALTLKSGAFADGGKIPAVYTGEGKDEVPEFTIENVPSGAKELALICDDPDAPMAEPYVHWVTYSIPADTRKLSKNGPQFAQGKNSWNRLGYGGPMPPEGHGRHRYYFRLYALEKSLTLKPGATKEELLKEMRPHVLEETVYMGTYERKAKG